ncbi:MAG: hypothetical protein GY832_30820, partial [Chloroflexi bacterium]|nr:hypothetical protein [Chloroflexota bacterium]
MYTDYHRIYRPDLLHCRRRRPSPLPCRLPLVCPGGVIDLFPWAGGGGMRGGELAVDTLPLLVVGIAVSVST